MASIESVRPFSDDQLIASVLTTPSENLNTKTTAPDCIKSHPVNTARDPLSADELTAARQTLVHKDFINLQFPRTRKVRSDPELIGQKYALISFIPSAGATPDEDGCFGVAKVRGCFNTVDDADDKSDDLIRNFDSYAEIDVVYVGKEFPVMKNNDVYVKETREVDIRNILDKTTRKYLEEKRKKEKETIDDIKRRQKEIEETPEQEDKESLDYYIKVRVKRANAMMRKNEANAVIKQCATVIEKTGAELADIEENHPEFTETYLDRYETVLKQSGINPTENPLMSYMR
jgi:hypothetical protein